MLEALAVTLPLVLAVMFVASGIAKLRRPDDEAGWADLGIPKSLRQPWLMRLHPWAEIVLGLALALLGGWLGALAALAALALMVAYLVMVARTVARKADASCACFGARKRVTRVTVIRNAWLSVLAAATVAVIWDNPLWGGALARGQWALILALAVAAVTVGVILWPEADAVDEQPAEAAPMAVPTGGADDELDYIRTRTPAVPVTLADGTVTTLRRLSGATPQLILSVSETCGACTLVIEKIPEWRRRLPEIEIRVLVRTPPGEGSLSSTEEPQSLHDVERYVIESVTEGRVPAAVLLGVDGLLAGGPVTGNQRVAEFVEDVYASLHEESLHEEG